MQQKNETIYLDNAATTRVDPEVAKAMTEMLVEQFGNPSSAHDLGLRAERRIRKARGAVAQRLAVDPRQLIFTSGGTEALALALTGTARLRRRQGHLLISAVEHPAVHDTAAMLAAEGHEVETIPVTAGGWVDPAAVAERLRPETFIVAVMHVNNETGIVQPVEEISRVIKAHDSDCRFLVDAVQSFGKLAVEPEALGADLLTLSAHKIHGPKGCGCLFVAPGIKLAPLWRGGDQEQGRRPGTENVAGIVGLGRAAELAHFDHRRLHGYAARIEAALREALPRAYTIGDADRRAPQIIAFALPGLRSETLVNALGARGIFVSSGSACHSQRQSHSRVMQALGMPEDHGVIRVSFGRLTEETDVARAADGIAAAIKAL